MSVVCFSTDGEDAAAVARALEACSGVDVHHEELRCARHSWVSTSSGLASSGVAQPLDGVTLAILCHSAGEDSSRTLLVDADGTYNSFLLDAIAATRGNVAIALLAPGATGDLAEELVAAGQRSVAEFYDRGRFVSWRPSDRAAEADALRRLSALCRGGAPAAVATESMRHHGTPAVHELLDVPSRVPAPRRPRATPVSRAGQGTRDPPTDPRRRQGHIGLPRRPLLHRPMSRRRRRRRRRRPRHDERAPRGLTPG